MNCLQLTASSVKADFMLFPMRVEESLRDQLLETVRSVFTEERFALLQTVEGDMVSPLVGKRAEAF